MDLAALKAEIAGAGYSGMTDEQVAAAVNAKTVAGPDVDVTVEAVQGYLGPLGLTTGIEAWLRGNPVSGAPSSVQVAATELLREINTNRIGLFRTSLPASLAALSGLLDALVAASLISAQNKTDLLAMAASTVPWWTSIGAQSPICVGDLIVARAS